MAHPNIHAKSSVKKWGGKPEDYIHIHEWFDATKAWIGHSKHRMFRHHSEGIFGCEEYFGKSFTYRTKSGFSFPLLKILKSNYFREPVEKEIMPKIKSNNLYDFKKILRIWKNIDNSSNSELELLFSIITFEIWIKKFKINIQ